MIFTSPVHAKDYSIPQLQIEVQINEDGTLRITEHRTYVFDGDYSWANYELPKSGFSAISNIQVSENGSNFTNLNTEEPGTFLVEESGDSINVKWFSEWQKEVASFCSDSGWIDKNSYKGVYWNLGIQIFLLLAGTVSIFMLHPILAVAMGVAFFASVFSMVIIRRTPKGEKLYQTWKIYHNALKNAEDYSIPENMLGRHFIYAIAVGLGKQNIELMFEQNPEAVSAIYWIIILPGSTASPADLASSFSNLAATGTSSAGGGQGGAGASAGSAGGGASGGAG